jgi:hypothetical protein
LGRRLLVDEKQILAEVERRKQRARDLGLVDVVFKLYFDGIKHYAAWSKSSPEAVHPDFRSAVATPQRTLKGLESFQGVELCIEESKFVFAFESHITTMPDGEDCHFGTVSLTVDGQDVFGINCHGDYDEYVGVEWKPYDIDGFIEGPWIGPLTRASKKIVDWKEKYRKESERRRNRDKAAELRKKFGL